jgi:magnesium-transporting ATPase (P-type)
VDANVAREDVRNFNAFDSAKKYSTVTINHNGKVVTYIKGAPERIIARCQTYLDENGDPVFYLLENTVALPEAGILLVPISLETLLDEL